MKRKQILALGLSTIIGASNITSVQGSDILGKDLNSNIEIKDSTIKEESTENIVTEETDAIYDVTNSEDSTFFISGENSEEEIKEEKTEEVKEDVTRTDVLGISSLEDTPGTVVENGTRLAKGATITDNGIVYTVNDDNTTVTLTNANNASGEVTIPETVSDDAGTEYRVIGIGDNVFQYTGITSVTGNSITTIGSNAFNNCTSLISVFLLNATTIKNTAFNGCTSLISVSLPNATGIEDSAFIGCISLESVSLPKVRSIGASAFNFCSSLQKVDLRSYTASVNLGDLFLAATGNLNIILNKDANVTGIGNLTVNAYINTYDDSEATINTTIFNGEVHYLSKLEILDKEDNILEKITYENKSEITGVSPTESTDVVDFLPFGDLGITYEHLNGLKSKYNTNKFENKNTNEYIKLPSTNTGSFEVKGKTVTIQACNPFITITIDDKEFEINASGADNTITTEDIKAAFGDNYDTYFDTNGNFKNTDYEYKLVEVGADNSYTIIVENSNPSTNNPLIGLKLPLDVNNTGYNEVVLKEFYTVNIDFGKITNEQGNEEERKISITKPRYDNDGNETSITVGDISEEELRKYGITFVNSIFKDGDDFNGKTFVETDEDGNPIPLSKLLEVRTNKTLTVDWTYDVEINLGEITDYQGNTSERKITITDKKKESSITDQDITTELTKLNATLNGSDTDPTITITFDNDKNIFDYNGDFNGKTFNNSQISVSELMETTGNKTLTVDWTYDVEIDFGEDRKITISDKEKGSSITDQDITTELANQNLNVIEYTNEGIFKDGTVFNGKTFLETNEDGNSIPVSELLKVSTNKTLTVNWTYDVKLDTGTGQISLKDGVAKGKPIGDENSEEIKGILVGNGYEVDVTGKITKDGYDVTLYYGDNKVETVNNLVNISFAGHTTLTTKETYEMTLVFDKDNKTTITIPKDAGTDEIIELIKEACGDFDTYFDNNNTLTNTTEYNRNLFINNGQVTDNSLNNLDTQEKIETLEIKWTYNVKVNLEGKDIFPIENKEKDTPVSLDEIISGLNDKQELYEFASKDGVITATSENNEVYNVTFVDENGDPVTGDQTFSKNTSLTSKLTYNVKVNLEGEDISLIENKEKDTPVSLDEIISGLNSKQELYKFASENGIMTATSNNNENEVYNVKFDVELSEENSFNGHTTLEGTLTYDVKLDTGTGQISLKDGVAKGAPIGNLEEIKGILEGNGYAVDGTGKITKDGYDITLYYGDNKVETVNNLVNISFAGHTTLTTKETYEMKLVLDKDNEIPITIPKDAEVNDIIELIKVACGDDLFNSYFDNNNTLTNTTEYNRNLFINNGQVTDNSLNDLNTQGKIETLEIKWTYNVKVILEGKDTFTIENIEKGTPVNLDEIISKLNEQGLYKFTSKNSVITATSNDNENEVYNVTLDPIISDQGIEGNTTITANLTYDVIIKVGDIETSIKEVEKGTPVRLDEIISKLNESQAYNFAYKQENGVIIITATSKTNNNEVYNVKFGVELNEENSFNGHTTLEGTVTYDIIVDLLDGNQPIKIDAITDMDDTETVTKSDVLKAISGQKIGDYTFEYDENNNNLTVTVNDKVYNVILETEENEFKGNTTLTAKLNYNVIVQIDGNDPIAIPFEKDSQVGLKDIVEALKNYNFVYNEESGDITTTIDGKEYNVTFVDENKDPITGNIEGNTTINVKLTYDVIVELKDGNNTINTGVKISLEKDTPTDEKTILTELEKQNLNGYTFEFDNNNNLCVTNSSGNKYTITLFNGDNVATFDKAFEGNTILTARLIYNVDVVIVKGVQISVVVYNDNHLDEATFKATVEKSNYSGMFDGTTPVIPGFIFEGYYADNDTSQYVFGTDLYGKTLYAKFTEDPNYKGQLIPGSGSIYDESGNLIDSIKKEDNILLPTDKEPIYNPDGTITIPNGSIIVSGGEVTILPDNTTYVPDNVIKLQPNPENGAVFPEGDTTENPDGSITLPNGGWYAKPDGEVEWLEPGTIIKLPNTITRPGDNNGSNNGSNNGNNNGNNSSGGSNTTGGGTNLPSGGSTGGDSTGGGSTSGSETDEPGNNSTTDGTGNNSTTDEPGNNSTTDGTGNNSTTDGTSSILDSTEPPFIDISGGWYEYVVTYTHFKGIVDGYEDKTFRPDRNITRAEFSVLVYNMLTRIYGVELDLNAEIPYEDVSSTAYYSKQIAALSTIEIIRGYGNGQFKPENLISREEAAIIIDNLVEYLNLEITEVNYTELKDFDTVSFWAEEAVINSVQNGLITGYTDETFRPKQSITRAETVQLLYGIITR